MKNTIRKIRTPLGTATIMALATFGITAVMSLQTAHAETADVDKRLENLEKELQAIKARRGDESNVVTVRQRGARMLLSTEDGNFTARVGGRLLLDSAWYDEDSQPMGSGTRFRQARLEAAGSLYRDWSYVFQYDFTNSGEGGIKEAYLGYNGFQIGDAALQLSVGNRFLPFGFLGQQSPKYSMFMEQPTSSLILGAGARRLGLRGDLIGGRWRWSLGAAQGILGSRPSDANGDDPLDIATQFTFNAIQAKNHVLNLGLSVRRQSAKDADTFRLRTRPQTYLSPYRPVDTGTFVSDGFTAGGAQVMYLHGPFEMEAEYFQQRYDEIHDGAADGEEPEFEGGYVQLGYFLTGESRTYKPTLDVFGPPQPARSVSQGGMGAWQVAASYSTLELTDRGIDGGNIDMMMLGLNWFPQSRLRFALEYGNVLDVEGGPYDGDKPSFVQARAQVEW
ncbi:MAG: OprO/OprP family phosphate-selective porin [Alcanivorax sp.]|nr:OprO/OprP family phosphate-selective porin [Alcanivorax sp.]